MSAVVEIPQAPIHGAMPPGTWRRWVAGRRVLVACPQCGESAPLDHTVAADGAVSPSLLCATDGCSWHVFGRLLGWTPPA